MQMVFKIGFMCWLGVSHNILDSHWLSLTFSGSLYKNNLCFYFIAHLLLFIFSRVLSISSIMLVITSSIIFCLSALVIGWW